MRVVFVLVLACMSFNFLNAQEINQKAKKYLDILSNKPSPGFMFDRFYGAWMESSDTKGLEEYLKKNSVEKPTSENILLLAFYYQKEGQTNQALGVLSSVEDPKLLTGEVLYYRARLESSALNFTNAIQHIDKAIASPIKDDLKQKLLKLKAQVQYRDGNSKGARETFETLLAINEKDKTIIEDVMEIQLAEGVYEDSKKYCQKLIDLSTDNYEKVSYQLKMATILKRLNDSENSEKIYLDLIGLSGQDSWLLKEVVYQFESIYRGKDNLTDLVKKYEEIIKDNPQNVYLRKRYSGLLLEKGEKDASINEFKAIVELLPGDRSIREEYAGLLISNGKAEEAVKILEVLVTSKSGSKDYEIILNIADLEFKNKRLPQANEWLQQFLAKKDLTEYEILRASNLLHKHGQVAKEIELLEKYAKEKPEAIAIKESLIHLYLESKDKEKALQVVKSLNISDDLDLNFRTINQFTKNKLLEEGLSILESANKENKETYRYHKRLFDLYSDFKNEEKKKEIAKTILKFCTSFVEIREAIQTIKGLHEDESLAIAIKDLESKEDLDFKEVLLLAHLKHKANQFDLAFKLLEDSNKKHGNEILFLELQENFFSSIREFEKSIQIVDELIKKSPKDISKYLMLKMNLHKRSGETDEAIACAKQLMVATNNKVEHVMALADLYQLKDEFDESIAVLRKASFGNVEDKSIKVKLADSYMAVQNYNDARRILWSLLEETEDITEKISYMDNLFNCYDYDLGMDALIENLKERRLNNAKNSFPLLALIRVYQRLNDTENRSKYMIELSQLKTDDVRLYLELSDVMIKDLDYEGAEATLKKAIEIDKGELARNKLVQFYFSVDKEEQAIMELLRLSQNAFAEKEIIEIVEKYIALKKYEKAYEFMKKHTPVDKTAVYDYIFAITAREAKMEDVEKLFYELLDKNEEFATAKVANPMPNNYGELYEKYYPEMFKKLVAFGQALWSSTSYQTNQGGRMNRYIGATPSVIVVEPASLKELHDFAIAHLGDIYRAGSDAKKTEILNELKNRNIEYAELFLLMDKNKINSGNDTTYKDFALKYPEDVALKVLSVLSDRSFFNNVDEKLLPLIAEVKEKDKKMAFWLYSSYVLHLKEIKQDVMTEIESLMTTLGVSEEIRLTLYSTLFMEINNRPKVIAQDLIEKYKPIILDLMDKNIEKKIGGYFNYYLMPLLARFKDVERYAKIINNQMSSRNTGNRSYGYGSHRNTTRLSGEVNFPVIVHQQFANQYYELYNKGNNNSHVDDDFRKKLIPFLENKYLKLSMYHFLQNEEEVENTIKEFEESKTFDDLQIVASYYGFRNKHKEAVIALNKALMLATTTDSKKSINGNIAFYATKIDDPIIKADGVNAAKRLKNFNLSKEELLELSMLLESLGESSEAEQLDDKISKMNVTPRGVGRGHNNPIESIGIKLDKMLNDKKNEAAFKFLISSLKVDFADLSNRIKLDRYFDFDSYEFDELMESLKKRKISTEFKKFVSEQKSLTDDDLVTIAFILYKLGEVEEATLMAKKLVEKRPKDLTYKILAYGLNLKNNKELDDDLKQEIKNDLSNTVLIIQTFWRDVKLFEVSNHDLKNLLFYILDNVVSNDDEEDAVLFVEMFLSPFLSGGNISKNVYVESVLNARSKKKNQKRDEKKILDDHYAFFEELMLKCMGNKMLASAAGSILFHYYIVNKMPISSEMMQTFSKAIEINRNANQEHLYMTFGSNGESLLPLHVSLAVHLLNQDKGAELDEICEKLAGDEKTEYKKIIEKLKIFYLEKPVTKKDLTDLGTSVGPIDRHPDPFLLVISKFLQSVDIKNTQAHDFLLTGIKESLRQENNRSYVNLSAFSKYLGRQTSKLNSEDAVNYLLDIEKKLLPKPFDKELFVKNKQNWNHYTRKISTMFAFSRAESFDFDLYKHMLKASRKSSFYFHVTRDGNDYGWRVREFSTDEILDSGLFTGNLHEIQVIRLSKSHFLMNEVAMLLREDRRQKKDNKLSKMEQTDGVKLLSYWAESKNYQKVFDFLGSKLAEFNALPMEQKVEWAEFLAFFYKQEINEKRTLNELGQEFKKAIDNLDDGRLEEAKKRFLEEKYEDEMSPYMFLELLAEVYPSLLFETEEKVLAVIKSANRKHKYYGRNHTTHHNDNYQHDAFVQKLLEINSPKRNHLVILTELLSQSSKWPPSYYRMYSSLVKAYMKQSIFDLMEKLGVVKGKNGRYAINADQEKTLKLELNAIIDDVVTVNKNAVPIYMFSFGQVLGTINPKDNALKELVAEWGAEKELPSLKKDIYFGFKSFLEKKNDILDDHFVSVIIDPATIPQIKSAYIETLNNRKLSQEKQKIVLDQHLSVIGLDSVNLASNPYPFYQLLEKYDYAILKQSSEELSKLLKNWYRNFEKALMESFKEDWKLDQYSVSNISNVDACQKLIKIMKDRLDEKQVSKFLREPKLGFKLYLPIYTTYLEEGLDDIVLETLNGNIEEIKVSLNRLGSKFLVKKDLDLIEKFVEKIEDSERKEFAKILFYRIGTKNTNGTKSLELFATSLKEMVKQPIKDAGIKRKLLELLSGTELMSDKDLIEMLNDSNEKFDENKLKTATYQEIGVSFRIYCRKFSKILVDEGLEKLKSEVDKTLANIQENSGNKDGFILAISDSLADDLRSDKNIIKNANVYREAIFYVLDSFGHAGDNGKLGFNYALCLLFLDNKGDQYSDIIDRYNKQHVFHWEKKLSTVEAIQLFKTAYLQNPEQSASILKSLNEFLNSKANDYYDFLSDDKAQNLFDFITTESDKKTVLESYKLFNQKEKAKQ